MPSDPPAQTGDATSASASSAAAGTLAWLATATRSHQLLQELPRDTLTAVPGCTPLQVQLLHNRGVEGAAAIQGWLAADWRAAAPLPDLSRAVARIRAAIAAGERIAVIGDFDADGITACALLTLTLRALGAGIEPHIPDREAEGRGLNVLDIARLEQAGVRLIITADCGTTSVAEVAEARRRRVDVIVTDHHTPHDGPPGSAPLPGARPDAVALVNPLLAPTRGPADDLSGAGVAFRLAQALLADEPSLAPLLDSLLDSLLDLAAIGTLVDSVALTSESWALARAGLGRLRASPRPGLAALLARAALPASAITERDVGFVIGPRLNAASRMGAPRLALDLLLAQRPEDAERLASQLEALNAARQAAASLVLAEARAQVATTAAEEAAAGPLVVCGDGWRVGLLGLVASQLAEEHGRAAVVISRGAEWCRGSARGPEDVDLHALLHRRADLFAHFGGHARAAGFSLRTADLDPLRAWLRTAAPLGNGAAPPVAAPLLVDCRLPLRRATLETYQAIRALAPYGPGFAEPRFLCERARLVRCWASGARGQTLRLAVRQGLTQRVLLWQRHGHLAADLRATLARVPEPLCDLVYSIGAYRTSASGPLELALRVEGIAT